MPIFGLVLVLESAQPDCVAEVERCLETCPDIEIGSPHEARLPIVLECAGGKTSSDERLRGLEDIPAVLQVEVVYSNFEDLVAPAPSEAPKKDGEPTWT
jgi:nitrate reductase NapAB chaperone NapD